jgi:hypothetical protein
MKTFSSFVLCFTCRCEFKRARGVPRCVDENRKQGSGARLRISERTALHLDDSCATVAAPPRECVRRPLEHAGRHAHAEGAPGSEQPRCFELSL